MAVNTHEWAGIASDTSRGPSASIWKDCPIFNIIEQSAEGAGGMYFFDDFTVSGQWATTNTTGQSFGQWASYGSTGALRTEAALEGGVLGLNSDAADESAQISAPVGSFRIVGASPYPLGQKLWFECRVAFGTVAATKMDTFVGLCDNLLSSGLLTNTIPISTTDDALSTTPNLIGFHKRSTESTEIRFTYNVAGGTVQAPTGFTTLMNTVTGAVLVAQSGQTGFVKLGFVFDPTAGNAPLTITSASTGQTVGTIAKPLIRVYVNGIAAPAFLTSTNVQAATFPTGFMGPVFATMQTAAGANTSYIDWIRVAQLGSF